MGCELAKILKVFVRVGIAIQCCGLTTAHLFKENFQSAESYSSEQHEKGGCGRHCC